MPNHVTSGVTIHHDDANKLKVLRAKVIVEEKEQAFDFNGIIPMPEHSDTFFRDGGLGQEEREKYGKNNWYDWSLDNWGTKWNAYNFKLVKEDDNNLHIEFDTAWAPPTPIFEKLEEMGFTVTAVSINEDMGVEPDYFGDPYNSSFYVDRRLEFWDNQ